MTVVREMWDSFAALSLTAAHPPEQWSEMRRAFYAGCYGMLMATVRISESVTDDEAGCDAAAAMMGRLERELKAFYADVAAGRA